MWSEHKSFDPCNIKKLKLCNSSVMISHFDCLKLLCLLCISCIAICMGRHPIFVLFGIVKYTVLIVIIVKQWIWMHACACRIPLFWRLLDSGQFYEGVNSVWS